jgi:hypothetical protein
LKKDFLKNIDMGGGFETQEKSLKNENEIRNMKINKIKGQNIDR